MSLTYENKILVCFKAEHKNTTLLEEHLLLEANQHGAWADFLRLYGNYWIVLSVVNPESQFGDNLCLSLRNYARKVLHTSAEIASFVETRAEIAGVRVFFSVFCEFYHSKLLVEMATQRERWIAVFLSADKTEVLFKRVNRLTFSPHAFDDWLEKYHVYPGNTKVYWVDSYSEDGLHTMKCIFLRFLALFVDKLDYDVFKAPRNDPARRGTLHLGLTDWHFMLREFDTQFCKASGFFVD